MAALSPNGPPPVVGPGASTGKDPEQDSLAESVVVGQVVLDDPHLQRTFTGIVLDESPPGGAVGPELVPERPRDHLHLALQQPELNVPERPCFVCCGSCVKRYQCGSHLVPRDSPAKKRCLTQLFCQMLFMLAAIVGSIWIIAEASRGIDRNSPPASLRWRESQVSVVAIGELDLVDLSKTLNPVIILSDPPPNIALQSRRYRKRRRRGSARKHYI